MVSFVFCVCAYFLLIVVRFSCGCQWPIPYMHLYFARSRQSITHTHGNRHDFTQKQNCSSGLGSTYRHGRPEAWARGGTFPFYPWTPPLGDFHPQIPNCPPLKKICGRLCIQKNVYSLISVNCLLVLLVVTIF